MDLIAIFRVSKELNEILQNTLYFHKKKNESVLLRKGGRLPEMMSAEKSLGAADLFNYELMDSNDKEKKEHLEYMRPFQALGRWSLIRFVMLNHTINPKSTFFIVWEITHCVFLIIQALIFLFKYSILFDYCDTVGHVIVVLKLISWVDVYIRFHIQYHDEQGLLITHPIKTAKHYLSTSFFIDFLGCIPTAKIGFQHLFFSEDAHLNEVIIGLFTNFLQMYRVSGALDYISFSMTSSKGMHLQTIKYMFGVTMAIAFFADFQMLYMCRLPKKGETMMKCIKGSWITHSHFRVCCNKVQFIRIISNSELAISMVHPPPTHTHTPALHKAVPS